MACGGRQQRDTHLRECVPVEVVDALTRLGGISARKPLVAAAGGEALRVAVRNGAVIKVHRSLYALPAADEAALAAKRCRGVVSHLSAALALGWKVKTPPAAAHVTVARNSPEKGSGGVRLHYANLPADEEVEVRGGRVTSPVRTAADCARSLPFDEALAVVDSALRSRTVTRAELLAAIKTGPRTGRTRAARVIRAADARSDNPFESVLRAIALEVSGFSAQPQGRVPGVGHADVADVRLRIALEAESWEFHGLREAFSYDIRRYTAMVRTGWLVARFTWDDVMHKPDYVREVIADLVTLRLESEDVRRRVSAS